MPKKKVLEAEAEVIPEVAEEVAEAPKPVSKPVRKPVKVNADDDVEDIETRNNFTLFRKGEGYSVKTHMGVVISSFTGKAEAEQLFRNMSRKF